ncbi:BS ykrK family protein [Pediococcus stilesii]|uniref:BS ykrK family protein n=2 Tax=Pediococcus stilesii TaxID=331679 RepID=A0A0R2L966_9LACO|nr:BS ykrK family protein [Pediococcus stilesii]
MLMEDYAMTEKEYDNWLSDFKKLSLPTFEQFPDLELYMDQVIQETNKYLTPIFDTKVTKTMINSYVKMELVQRPIKKKYTAEHVATIMIVSILKTTFTLDSVKKMMVNDGIQDYFNRFVLKFNHELHNFGKPVDSFSQLEITIRTVLYKVILEKNI